jgi:hypothetical protein
MKIPWKHGVAKLTLRGQASNSFLYALICLPFWCLIPKGEKFVDQRKPKYIKYQNHHFQKNIFQLVVFC